MSQDNNYLATHDLSDTRVLVEGFAWKPRVSISRGKTKVVLDEKTAPLVREALAEWERDNQRHQQQEARTHHKTRRPKSGVPADTKKGITPCP